MESSILRLKILINSRSKKVLFAEVGKDFVDFLFCIMALPVGTLIRLTRMRGSVDSLTNLCESIRNLNGSYLQPDQKKETLLDPIPSIVEANLPRLPTDTFSTDRRLYRYIGLCNCVTDVFGIECTCGYSLTDECEFVAGNTAADLSPSEGGFVKGAVTYVVMDDLTVHPMSSISSITSLNKLDVEEIECLEEKMIRFGPFEVIKLLRASLRSQTVLTDVFLS